MDLPVVDSTPSCHPSSFPVMLWMGLVSSRIGAKRLHSEHEENTATAGRVWDALELTAALVKDTGGEACLLDLLEGVQGKPSSRRVSSEPLQVQAVLLQMAGHVLPRHSLHVHQLQDRLWNRMLHPLFSKQSLSIHGRQRHDERCRHTASFG